jgi:hypothetical protein
VAICKKYNIKSENETLNQHTRLHYAKYLNAKNAATTKAQSDHKRRQGLITAKDEYPGSGT